MPRSCALEDAKGGNMIKYSVHLLLLVLCLSVLVSCGSGPPRDVQRYLEDYYERNARYELIKVLSVTPSDPHYGDEEWCVWVRSQNTETGEIGPAHFYLIREGDRWGTKLLTMEVWESYGCPLRGE